MRERIENLDLSIRKISRKAEQQEECIRFDIGQPSFDTPKHVKEGAEKGLKKKQSYSPVVGLDELREEVAREENKKEGINVEKENVMITTGGMGALFSIFTSRLGNDDKVVLNDPSWNPYKMISEVSGNRWKQVRYWDEDRKLREEARKEIIDSDMVVVNTPSNPQGYVLTKEQAREIGELAQDHGTFLISDEVYHRLTYGKKHISPASYTDNSAIVGSVSKNHAMTGWRIGWVIDNEENINEYAKVSRASTACPPRISQYAAIEALKNDSHVEEMRNSYEQRKDIITDRMKDMGLDFKEPEGAIYAFPDLDRDSWKFCMDMVERGVAMVPGEPFGPESNTNARICFGSTDKERLKKGLNILENWI